MGGTKGKDHVRLETRPSSGRLDSGWPEVSNVEETIVFRDIRERRQFILKQQAACRTDRIFFSALRRPAPRATLRVTAVAIFGISFCLLASHRRAQHPVEQLQILVQEDCAELT